MTPVATSPSDAVRDTNDGAHYTRTAIGLHWTMAVLIVVNWSLGWTMSGLAFSPSRVRLFNYHKWIGITILAIAGARLAWRVFHAPPPLPADVARWQRGVAHAAHAALYVLFFAVPIAGWAFSSAAGFPVVVFGVLPLPDLAPVDEALASRLGSLHAILAFTLAGLVAAHVAGAIVHALADPIHYLRRMLTSRAEPAR